MHIDDVVSDVWCIVATYLSLVDVVNRLQKINTSVHEITLHQSFWEVLFKAHCSSREFDLVAMCLHLPSSTQVPASVAELVVEGIVNDWNRVLWKNCYKYIIVPLRGKYRVFGYLRLRPLLNRETEMLAVRGIAHVPPQMGNGIKFSTKEVSSTQIHLLDSQETQDSEVVFQSIGSRMVYSLVFKHQSSCAMAYGATSTGKTHTILGLDREGLAPRCIRALFDLVEHTKLFEIYLEVFEVYNEDIKDLLSDDPRPPSRRLRWYVPGTNTAGPVVEGLTKCKTTSFDEWWSLFESATTRRVRAQTFMSQSSSRSHLFIQTTCRSAEHESVMLFCDLAGSERITRSGAYGQQLQEAQAINRSLNSLGEVVRSLTNDDKFVPYRDSKVTSLLRRVLVPSSQWQLHIVGTLSPCVLSEDESINTSRFIERCCTLK